MRIARLGPEATAADVRALAPAPASVAPEVARIVEHVRTGGDGALLELTARLDGVELAPAPLAMPPAELEAAAASLRPELLDALRAAIANVRAVAEAQLRDDPPRVALPQGHAVELRELPVHRAGAYVPGGRAPYPSSVVMCAVTAQVAGVEELAVATPPGPGGRVHPLLLAACLECGVREVYRVGGAQAIAALAHGTESVAPVDVIVGPGNAYVTEAKRQLQGVVGIDGLAGPSELVVVASEGADPDLVALDLLAQAEHGPASLVVAVSAEGVLLEEVVAAAMALEPERPSVADAPLAAVRAGNAQAAVELADAIAPEHLELVGAEAEALAGAVRNAGCLFVGRDAATAFGDYVAGSNHVLPTGGAARFSSGLGPAAFRRRMARVSLPPGAAAALAPHGVAIARAEGFPVHAESMERRA